MPEDKHTEWKTSWRDEYLKHISGFANAQGGVLQIGKNDQGKIVGVAKAQKLLEDLPNKIRDILGIIPEIDLVKKRGKSLILIKIKSYKHPVNYKGNFYYRSGSTNQELKGPALHHFLLEKTGQTWDGVAISKVFMSALDSKVIADFKEKAVDSKRLPVKILKETNKNLIEKQLKLKDGRSLKRAAVLLFHPDPEMYITGAYIKIGYFKTEADVLFHDEVHGDLFSQVEKTMDLLLTKYLKAFISYKGLYRIESYPVPESALREALLNAVIHRDYSTGSPIQIRVYDDKIMFWNTCHLPAGWTVKNIVGKHQSRPHNPDIAKTFFLANMIETWGRGISKMKEECQAYGVPGPKIWGYPTDICVEFKNHTADMKRKLNKAKKTKMTPETAEVTPETTKVAPETTKVAPETTKVAPETTKVAPKTTKVAPETTKVAPETAQVIPKTTKMIPKTTKMIPKTTKMIPETTKMIPETMKMIPETPKVTPETANFDPIQEKILQLLTKKPKMTVLELVHETNKSVITIKRHIKKLTSAGYLKRIGPNKGGYWKVIKPKK